MDPRSETLYQQAVPPDGFCVWSSIAASLYCNLRAGDYDAWNAGKRKRYAGLAMAAAGKVLSLQGSDSDPYFFDTDVTPFPIHEYGRALEEAGVELVRSEKNAIAVYDAYSARIKNLYAGHPLTTGSYRWHQMGVLDLDAACVGLGLDFYFYYDSTIVDDFVVVKRHTQKGMADDMVLCDRSNRENQEKQWARCVSQIQQLIADNGLKPPAQKWFGICHNGVHYSGLSLCTGNTATDSVFRAPDVLAPQALSLPAAKIIRRREGSLDIMPLLLSKIDVPHNHAVTRAIKICRGS